MGYALWLLVLLSLVARRKKCSRFHLAALLVYSCILVAILANENNFRYGSSLLILVAGGAFLLLHFLLNGLLLIANAQIKLGPEV